MYFKVYAILAHKNPSQLKELISLLQYKDTLFFIHIDKKSKLSTFKEEIQFNNCYFIENRVLCKWGTFSLVEATTVLFESIKRFMSINHKDADYHTILLSGEDLPLKTNKEIHDYLKENKEYSFLEHWELPDQRWWDGGLFRFKNLYFFKYQYSTFNKCINKVINRTKFVQLLPYNRLKKSFPNFKIYGSSQWLILNKLALNKLLKSFEDEKKLRSIFRYTLAPDETLFASLLLNSIPQKLLLKNKSLTFVSFKGNKSSPEYLKTKNIQNIQNDDYLFARKFDSSKNSKSIYYIKNSLLK
ncbi:beta-1,6-N-acetylglucosaminyltransferase [Bizionia gelidisalsuginis]|uniref:Peptide O-xylosyltransferase n=1 Tax=Bizionia gelidisalsuginis TaxID=291188 RepID=A0ABY3MDG1_9FLAO|nr:beta-1,6-N-acetylglucosaminyltransferase [Bizionia gelidisalsuginis]TYC17011.1 beta-1,6-N-acetylglucosaminyltransferase [Bizionia gelidisalsuginis]